MFLLFFVAGVMCYLSPTPFDFVFLLRTSA